MKKSTMVIFLLSAASTAAAFAATPELEEASSMDLVVEEMTEVPSAEIEVESTEDSLSTEAVAPMGAPFEANWPSITFKDGIPVGGWASVKMWPDGNYQFRGNFHDSGATSYDDSIVIAVVGHNGYVLTFSHSGHTAGTFEPGSRDDNWSNSGRNKYIKTHWNEFAGAGWKGKAHTSLNIGSLLNSIKAAIGFVKELIPIVGGL